MKLFKKDDRVTGAEGRDSHGWHGTIVSIGKTATNQPLYQVYWEERANSTDKRLARSPVIAMRHEQLIAIDGSKKDRSNDRW